MSSKARVTHAWRWGRKNIGVDHNLIRAEATLYSLYYVYLREHPEIAPLLANLLLQIDQARGMLRDFHTLCWESTPGNFDDVGEMAGLLAEAYRDVMGPRIKCQGYLHDLEAGANELLRLQSRLGERLPKLSRLLNR